MQVATLAPTYTRYGRFVFASVPLRHAQWPKITWGSALRSVFFGFGFSRRYYFVYLLDRESLTHAH